MSLVEFDRPPSWSNLDASKTAESKKMTVARGGGGHGVNPTTPTHRHYALFPVSFTLRDKDGGPSNSTSDIYKQKKK